MPAVWSAPVRSSEAQGRKGERREQALLDSLERLLKTQRIAEISVEDIARGAGVTRSAFYAYFPTRYAALAAALIRLFDPISAASVDVVRSEKPVDREVMRGILRPLTELWRDHAPLLHSVIEAAGHDRELERIWAEWIESFAEPCMELFRLACGESVTDSDLDLRALVHGLLWSNERNLYVAFRASRSSSALEAVLELMTTIWIAVIDSRRRSS